MSKPLELTVYQTDPGDSDCVDVNGYWEYRPHSTNKRFTDAELAAEYHQQTARHTMICYDDVYLRYVEEVPAVTTGPERYEEFRRAQTLYRFAILPHHDEPQS